MPITKDAVLQAAALLYQQQSEHLYTREATIKAAVEIALALARELDRGWPDETPEED